MRTVEYPETLDEFRQYYKERDLKEIKIEDNHPYNSRTIGWELMEGKRVLVSASNLHKAYKRLWAKEITR